MIFRQNQYFDIDFLIGGRFSKLPIKYRNVVNVIYKPKNSIKPLATVTRFICTTFSNAMLSLPFLQPGIRFRSKVFALAYPKRTKHEQGAKDIIYLLENTTMT